MHGRRDGGDGGDALAFLQGGGEMGALMRAHDWAATPLGPAQGWPQSLRTATSLVLRSPVPLVLLWGEDGIMIYNDAYSVFAAGRHPALLGSKVREGWPEVAAFNDRVMRAGLAGETLSFRDQELTLRRRGAPEPVWMDLDYSPVLDESGGPAGVLAIVVETTDRVLSQRRLAESEARLRFLDRLAEVTQPLGDPTSLMAAATRLLGEHLGASVCAYADMEPDQDGFTIRGDWAAPGASSIVGSYRLEAFGSVAVGLLRAGRPLVTRDTLAELGPEQGAALLGLGLRATVCMPFVKEGRLTALMAVHSAAPRAWTDAEIVLIAETTERCWAFIERVRAEARLRELNETLEAQVAERTEERDRVWRHSLDLLSVIDLDTGTFDAVNPAWTTSLGWSTAEIVARSFADFVHPDDVGASAEAFERVRRGEPALHFENRYRADGGGWRWLSWVAVPEGGKLYAVTRDVTAEKERQAELEEAQEALRQAQKLEAIGQLTGGVAHDFNNLLTIIRSSTDLLRKPGLPEERRRRYVDAISDTVDRAARLTGQLLAFARRQALRPEVFDPAERIRTVAEMLRTVVGSRVRIEVEADCEGCFVEADASQFETALVNMVVNARDAMEGEGRLTIRVAPQGAMPAIRGHGGGRGRFVAVSLTDTGSGIPPDRLGKIFEPFFTTKEVGKGTGLGLSQVYGFAKQSGGDVAVESEAGRGATFTLYLPRVDEAAAGATDAKGGADIEEGRGRRVLVVEDNVEVGAFSTQLLEDLGYETTWAVNAGEALRHLAAGPGRFDVVFTDVVMPGMSGVELGHEIRRLYPRLSVVLTSGYSHVLAEEGRHGFELLQKPYAAEELSRLLRRAARGRRSGR